MAEQIFPLSPIAARAALPSDEDYDAIREAFMETARGRWFLNEYTNRNRNADTSLVLDAVARLEASIAAQKQPQPEAPPQHDRIPALLATITAMLVDARHQAVALLPTQETPAADSPALKGVRVLREMAWAMRESGSDGRVPDLLQKQATAIEDGLKANADHDVRDKLLAVFDNLSREIELIAQGTASVSAASPEATASVSEPDAPAEALSELDDTLAVLSDEFGRDQPDDLTWHQPQPSRPDTPVATQDNAVPIAAATPVSEPVSAPVTFAAKPPAPAPTPLPAISLGAAVLEQGIVAKPESARGDPLAPFRRMTQAEKIAFFS